MFASDEVAHPPEKLLVSILDPNATIEPGYLAYSCTLVSGEELYGIITSEAGGSIHMKTLDAVDHAVPRAEIVSLTGSKLSLMPEGLEEGLKPQDLLINLVEVVWENWSFGNGKAQYTE